MKLRWITALSLVGSVILGILMFALQPAVMSLTATLQPTATPLGGGAGHILFVSEEDDDMGIYIIQTDGSNRRKLTDKAAFPVWSPNGERIAYSCYSEICIMNADGTNIQQITNNELTAAQFLTWSPDGQQIAFTERLDGYKNAEIFIVNADGSNLRNLTNQPNSDYRADWSPDGRQIAFTSDRSGNKEIYLIDIVDSKLWNLTNSSKTDDMFPVWSPDGRQIVFTSQRENNPFELYVINIDGSNKYRLTMQVSEPIGFYWWSPNGQQILFGNYEGIFLINADGSDERQLIYNQRDYNAKDYNLSTMPMWSPDGQQISFIAHQQEQTSIMIMNIDGSNKTQITNIRSITLAHPAIWQPAPR